MKQLLALVFLSVNWLSAQDIHFSQLSINSMVNNPAAAGLYNGWERLAVNHKNQWINANTSFLTTSIAADLNLFKPNNGKGAYLGVGILAYNDVGGDSKFGLKHFSVSISGIVPLNRNNRISFGLSPGFGQRSAQLSGLLFPNQFNGQELNGSIASFELPSINSNLYGDFSAGFLYQYGSTQKSIVADRTVSLTLGVSYHHINTPTINFNDTYIEDLFGKLAIGAELIKDFSGSNLGIESFATYFNQGPHTELFLATLMRYQLASGSKMTSMKKQVILSYGLGYRHADAIIPMVKLQKGSWQFGLSYDITVSTLGAFNRSGGLEFSLVFNSNRFAIINRR